MKILVLGGAGLMARVTVRDLLERTEATVGVADVDAGRARRAVKDMGSDRAEAIPVDVRDSARLVRVLKDWDVAINETWYTLNLEVMDAAIAAGVHYVDLGGLYHGTIKQLARDRAAKDAGITALVCMGSTPGTMNVMAALGGSKLDRIDTVKLRSAGAVVQGGSADEFVVPYSIRTILDEFSFETPVFRDGKVVVLPPLSGGETFELPPPVGKVYGINTIHSEIATLPGNLGKGIRELEFKVGFPKEFIETLSSLIRLGFASRKPIRVGDRDVVPYDVTSAVIDALPKPKEPVLDVDIQRCEFTGTREGRRATLIYDCISSPNMEWMIDGGAVGTGTPPAIAAAWIATGRIKARGVVPPEVAVDPLPFFRELGAKGRTIEVWERDATRERLLSKAA